MNVLRRLWPLLALLLGACQRPEDPIPPAGLLSRPQMVRLLTELHLLEARVDASRLPPDSARALFLSRQAALLRQANATDSAFQRSYRYYSVHGKDLDELYKAVIDSLAQQERRLGGPQNLSPEEARRRGLPPLSQP